MPPLYEYFCPKCKHEFEVIKPISEYNSPEKCEKCKKSAIKLVSSGIFFTGTKIEDAEWNPGLGIITKSKKHRDEIVKRKNLIEIGNENPDTIHKHQDKAREEKRRRSWEDV